MESKTALIVTGNQYPQGDAGAVRQHAFALLLRDLGYTPRVVGYGAYTGDCWKDYEGVTYCSLRPSAKNRLLRAWGRVAFGHRVERLLRRETQTPDVILMVDGLPDLFRRLERYARRDHVMLLHDSVEWYSPEEFVGGRRNLEYQLKEYTNRCAVRRGWRVVAISRYLEAHFRARGCLTARIPVILDVQAIAPALQAQERPLTVVYTGNPGGKDDLAGVVRGFLLLPPEERAGLRLRLIGPDARQLTAVCGLTEAELAAASDFLELCGRVSRAEALAAVRAADCTVLLRDETLRYARAGFPTKVVESLACATPVMTNLSSDLADYLRDGENAFVIDGHTPEDVARAARRLLGASQEERARMRAQARATAETSFDYRRYRETLRSLLEG